MSIKTKEPKRRKFIADIRVGNGGMDASALGELAKRSPDTFMARCQELIDKGELSLDTIRDMRHLHHALGPVQATGYFGFYGSERAVMSSAFPLLMGGLTVAFLNDAFDAVPTIGQDLVKEIDDPKKVTEIAAITSHKPAEDTTKEGDEYPEIGAGEERFEIRSKRQGYRLSITRDALEENDVNGFVDRVNALAEIGAEEVEEQTLRRVTDHDGSASGDAEPYVLRPNGAGTPLYSSSANTPNTRTPNGTRILNNALENESDIDAARIRLAQMLNSRGKRIHIPMSEVQILAPTAVEPIALRILNSEKTPGVQNEQNQFGPLGKFRPKGVLSSPKMDDLSTSAWYYGWFQKQFTRKWKRRFELVTLGTDTESYLRADIAFQARIAWDVEIGARDVVYVIQNLTASTAPADE